MFVRCDLALDIESKEVLRMNAYCWKIKMMLVSCFIVFCVSTAAADESRSELLNKIVRDMESLEGHVVMVKDNDILIDLDQSTGVVVGDIFTLSKAGEKVIHPHTQKMLGVTEEIQAVLKISRVRAGFSHAQSLMGREHLKKGDKVVRYNNLRVQFMDYTDGGRDFYTGIHRKLPNLNFEAYRQSSTSKGALLTNGADTSPATLYFILKNKTFEIRDYHSNPLRIYALSDLERRPSIPLTGKTKRYGKHSSSETWGIETLYPLPVSCLMADFLKRKNQLLMVSTDGVNIVVFRIGDLNQPVAETTPSFIGKILSIKWWAPDVDQPPYAAVTIWDGKKVCGALYRMDHNRLTPVVENISRILGAFDLDGDNRPETLLGQDFDSENFFGTDIKKIKLVSNKAILYPFPLSLPARFTVLGGVLADINGDSSLEAVFVRNSILYIYSGKKRTYKSPPHMGGSASFLTYDTDPASDVNTKTATARIEISPLVLDLDDDGGAELVLVASKKSTLGKLGIVPGLEKSTVTLVKSDGGRYVSRQMGEEQDLSIQGLTFDKGRFLLVGTLFNEYGGDNQESYMLRLSR